MKILLSILMLLAILVGAVLYTFNPDEADLRARLEAEYDGGNEPKSVLERISKQFAKSQIKIKRTNYYLFSTYHFSVGMVLWKRECKCIGILGFFKCEDLQE